VFISHAQQFSTTDFYLDAGTLLPVAVSFQSHPDGDAGSNIAVEIDFSNYQPSNGIQVPFRIQKLVQGSLTLDFTVSSVVLNSGLPDSLFAIQ
jgi:hypothetical protein